MSPGNVFTIEPIFMMKDVKTAGVWEDDFTLIAPGIPSGNFLVNVSFLFVKLNGNTLY